MNGQAMGFSEYTVSSEAQCILKSYARLILGSLGVTDSNSRSAIVFSEVLPLAHMHLSTVNNFTHRREEL